jgi:hypothetical protein
VGYSHRVTLVDKLAPTHLPMPPSPAAADGQPEQLLPGFAELPRPVRGDDDPDLDRVAAALRAADQDATQIARAIRDAFDLLLDGQHCRGAVRPPGSNPAACPLRPAPGWSWPAHTLLTFDVDR